MTLFYAQHEHASRVCSYGSLTHEHASRVCSYGILTHEHASRVCSYGSLTTSIQAIMETCPEYIWLHSSYIAFPFAAMGWKNFGLEAIP
jgi:hypothetical protein